MKLYLSSYGLGNKPERLLKLLSNNKKAGVIINSMDMVPEEVRREKLESEISDLRTLGIQGEELDLRNYFSKEDELRRKLLEYKMVWVRGGNTFILRRAYAYSGFDKILKEKLSGEFFVYAGYSAGICLLAPSLKGLEIVDDPNLIPKGYQPKIIWEGLGFLDYSICPHYRSNHPESRMIEKSVQYFIDNKIKYKTLRDGEVIIEEI